MFRRQDRASSIVEHFCRRGSKEHATEPAGVSRHNDEIESVRTGNRCNLFDRITGAEDSWTTGNREISFEERIKLSSCDVPVFFGNLLQ
jgi:hypothetical protein